MRMKIERTPPTSIFLYLFTGHEHILVATSKENQLAWLIAFRDGKSLFS